MIGLISLAAVNFATGNTLYDLCNGTGVNRIACQHYISGASDAFQTYQETNPRLICLPSTVTLEQMTDVVVVFLRDHPAQRHYSASSEVWLALQNAFPCPSPKKKR